MTERPMIFSDESVRAILSGTKTMTRRLIGKRPVKWAVGDRVWVKEAFALSIIDPDGFNDIEDDEHYDVVYRADTGGGEWTHYEPDGDGFTQTSIPPPWRSPLFMPRWASRISREVTGVRAEHLHDMPKADVYAEGITEEYVGHFREWYDSQWPWMAFANKWNELHGKRAPWESNPLVTVITFRRIDA